MLSGSDRSTEALIAAQARILAGESGNSPIGCAAWAHDPVSADRVSGKWRQSTEASRGAKRGRASGACQTSWPARGARGEIVGHLIHSNEFDARMRNHVIIEPLQHLKHMGTP